MSEFVSIDVEPGPAAGDGVSLRFKRVSGVEERVPHDIPYESEGGIDGRWRVLATDDADAVATRPARALLVEDSSDGSAWLIAGGTHGLVLEHEPSGVRVREPYLVLSKRVM